MSDTYKPYNEEHSVFEVVWKFTFNKKISDENYEEFKEKYKVELPMQKLGYIPKLKINIETPPTSEEHVSAFKEKTGFLAWNSNSGWIIEVVQDSLLIRSRKYKDWDNDFKIAFEFAKTIMNAIKDPSNFIKNIFLIYDDRFSNIGGLNLEYNQIFKERNEFIPINCYSQGTCRWQSQINWADSATFVDGEILNQLSISSIVDSKDDKTQMLIISHAGSFHLNKNIEKSIYFKDEKNILEKYSLLHETNKKVLNKLLTEKVLRKINYLLGK